MKILFTLLILTFPTATSANTGPVNPKPKKVCPAKQIMTDDGRCIQEIRPMTPPKRPRK